MLLVALNTFGEVAPEIVQVNVPSHVLAPNGMEHPLPEIVAEGLATTPFTVTALKLGKPMYNA